MNINDFRGKNIANSQYFHVDSFPCIDDALLEQIDKAIDLVGLKIGVEFNVVKLSPERRISLLNYPHFFLDPFPSLQDSWQIDIDQQVFKYRTYKNSFNPPILHRKELLLTVDHSQNKLYSDLTAAAESIGLFDDTKRIGYLRQWQLRVRDMGYQIVDHALVPIGNDEADEDEVDQSQSLDDGWEAQRQRTALVRYGFSAPIQTLARYGFLDGGYQVFDYGCGRGDDLRGLNENSIQASGWDPYYAPDNEVKRADIVNLGFVINVIEDLDERIEALIRAWNLADRLLVVSVMLSNQNANNGRVFADGVMTSRGTFQKYYTQAEIMSFIEQVLDEEPIPVAPGVLYVFSDKESEQRFLVDRYRRRANRLREPSPQQRKHREEIRQRAREETLYQSYKVPLEQLWSKLRVTKLSDGKTLISDHII